MKKFLPHKAQGGFTLIELMIAMLIGIFLMAGVIQIFLSAKQAYRLQENLSRLQENGRFAMDMIAQDIRMAGYVDTACLPPTATMPPTLQALLPVANANSPTSNTNWCSNAAAPLTTVPPTNPTIAGMSCISSIPPNGTNSSATALNTTAPANTTAGNIRTDVIRSYQWISPTNCTAALLPTATNGSEISYFIKADDSNSNVAALWRYPGSNTITTAQERVEGIETMNVLYGVDTDATPDYIPNYYADAGAADLTKIVSVRINLVAVTSDIGLTDAPQPYTFNGMRFTPPNVCVNNGAIAASCTAPAKSVPDTRIRRVFSSTIAVRNRLR